jgi:hypothetical protein
MKHSLCCSAKNKLQSRKASDVFHHVQFPLLFFFFVYFCCIFLRACKHVIATTSVSYQLCGLKLPSNKTPLEMSPK